MIYLTFDTNIWIYSLDDSWRVDNDLDYLEYWIEKGEVKLLLPQLVVDEWGNNRDKQVKDRERKLKNFFNMAKEILPSAFFAEYKKPLVQEQIINDQLKRINKLINSSEIIPKYPEIANRVVKDGIEKKAPLNSKSSVADAVIIFSLFQYAELHPHNQYFFITNNTSDFFEKDKKNINKDLEPEFITHDIKYFTTLNQLTANLQNDHKLSENKDIRSNRQDRIKNKLKARIYNPDYDKLFESEDDSYILNINTIKFILAEEKPTREQVIYVLALVDSDEKYERDFYKHLTKPNWFKILQRKGVFNPKNNPAPIPRDKNHPLVTYWAPLTYLEKVSLQIKDGEQIGLTEDILSIITAVSRKPVDNFTTWDKFVRILANLPNQDIPTTILDFIPNWLDVSVNMDLLYFNICEFLLPKFLSDNLTQQDVVKAELILKHLFFIKEKGKYIFRFRDKEDNSVGSFNFLYSKFTGNNLIKNIAAHCSNQIIIDIAENIKLLHFPQSLTVTLKIKQQEYVLKIEIQKEDLNVNISNTSSSLNINDSIEKFENLTTHQTKEEIISFLNKSGVDYEENEENEHILKLLLNKLINGPHSTFHNKNIGRLDALNNYNNEVFGFFSLLFTGFISEKIQQKPEAGLTLLESFFYNNKYRLPFFKKVVLFVIGENWTTCRELFWDIVEENDSGRIFSTPRIQDELYELLNKNQTSLKSKDIQILQNIIAKGRKSTKKANNADNKNYWQLRWYSALRDIAPFDECYKQLSEEINCTHEDYERGRVSAKKVVFLSPATTEEILRMEIREVVHFLCTFESGDYWKDEPTIEGLADNLKEAIKVNPNKFSEGIYYFEAIPFDYILKILYGFKEAWEQGKKFNWQNILTFFKNYVSTDQFTGAKVNLENVHDPVNTDSIISPLTYLLSAGMQVDDNAFDSSLLPIAKDILKTLTLRLVPIEKTKTAGLNSLPYSFDYKSEQTIRCLLDYSLRRARTLKKEENQPKWEQEIKDLFEELLNKGIIDSYTILGRHFQQFYFLDEMWILNKFQEYYALEDKYWLAFIYGLTTANPYYDKKVYQILYPHYERAIEHDIQSSKQVVKGVISHIVHFFFWEFEDASKKGLLYTLINKGSNAYVLKLVEFIGRQKKYLKDLNDSKRKDLEIAILDLWEILASKYRNTKHEEEQKILTHLLAWYNFIPQLDDKYAILLLTSVELVRNYHDFRGLLNYLLELTNKNYQSTSDEVRNVGRILNSINFNSYLLPNNKTEIISIATFLYENDQKDLADQFCNKMAEQGNDFLIALFNKYK